MSDYPPPASALMVWKAGDKLMVRIPPSAGHDRGHVLNFPFDSAGIGAMKMCLAYREMSCEKIGHKSAPTQDMADTWIKAMKAGKTVTKIKTVNKEAERRAKIAEQAKINVEIDSWVDELLGDL